ncbi:HEAT repeat domain-containing protein [Planomonospora corallina]|uniref:HEAT repeat domain-containing protein n=1 Tax=Planomonospora corallina TaxID=1806052 RepID=A0ABV8I4X3_9ACTN
MAAAAGDASREVRVQAARGLGVIGKPSEALAVLARDPDPLVRAEALESSGAVGAPLADLAVQALADPAWQVRVGAARCLGAAGPEHAAGPLVGALADANLDVRKAAVLALGAWAERPEVAGALRGALSDSDADVRAHARRALARVG